MFVGPTSAVMCINKVAATGAMACKHTHIHTAEMGDTSNRAHYCIVHTFLHAFVHTPAYLTIPRLDIVHCIGLQHQPQVSLPKAMEWNSVSNWNGMEPGQ